MKPRVLLFGENGQIGSELMTMLPEIAETIPLGRAQLDLRDTAAVRAVIREVHPSLIINAAAYTAVDRAESEHEAARLLNAEAPRFIAEEAKALGAAVIHFSTDYVFDGSKGSPYLEDDIPHPINVYGATKLAGEEAIRSSGATHLIFRTSWVYSSRGQNFVLTILRLASQRDELRIVNDQIGSPTWAREVATATCKVLRKLNCAGGELMLENVAGTYHMTATGSTSWYDFCKAILEQVHVAPKDLPWVAAATSGRPVGNPRLAAISTSEYPTPACRPAYSVLSNRRLTDIFDVTLPDWDSQLKALFASL